GAGRVPQAAKEVSRCAGRPFRRHPKGRSWHQGHLLPAARGLSRQERSRSCLRRTEGEGAGLLRQSQIMPVRAAIYGCSGTSLSEAERRFFRAAAPWGFIVFARNIETPAQLRRLTAELCDSVGREAPVLIDQE